MKNGCKDIILEAKVVERNERAKKLYRYVTDVARRIDEATAGSNTITELFSTQLEVQRQKLRDNCEKLFFLDPLNYGKKSLELLWRKVYYETISSAKKLQESENDQDNFLYTHIVCGVGNFHHLVSKIVSEMKISIKKVDFMGFNEDEEVVEVTAEPTEEESQFGKTALHSCLIYLGDLCRYQVELFHTFDPCIAARYYLQALHLDLSSGMPFNQLGNLYLDRNYNLNAVCYYIQCLSCTNPFEGALGNLTKIFDKNNQVCDTLNDSETLTQAEHVQNTVANFLSLIEIWYMGKNDTNIPQRCSAIAHELKIAMDFNIGEIPDINKKYQEFVQMTEEEKTTPSCFNNNLIHNMVQICLLTIAKLAETDEQKAFACKAFTLALFSQLLQRLLKQLQLLGFQNPAIRYKPKVKLVEETSKTLAFCDTENTSENKAVEVDVDINGKTENIESSNKTESTEDIKNINNGDVKNNKKILAKRRRRRRRSNSDSSDFSDESNSTDEEAGEEVASDGALSDSTYETEDESKSEESLEEDSTTEVEYDLNDDSKIKKEQHQQDEKSTDKIINGNIDQSKECELNDITENNNKSIKLNGVEIQKFFMGENFLHSIKLLQDWALTEKDLILSCGDSGEVLFQCVIDLLNIFTFYFNIKSSDDLQHSEVIKYAKTVAKNLRLEYKSIPLPEDVNLRGTSICKFDKDAAEWHIIEKYNISPYEENVIRIMNFIDFGQQIAKIVPKIRYNRSLKIFYLKKVPIAKISAKVGHKRSREWHNSKKMADNMSSGITESALLRRLGKLWLASRVKELERSGRRAEPSFLAVDSAALNLHLRRIKQLIRARSFVLLVPTIVLQELDDMKKERSTARDAIRWLEVQLRSGSRFLRAQRPGQSRPLPLLKFPRKAPTQVHNFIQILEFCNHFTAEERTAGGDGDPDSLLSNKPAPLLVLLIGTEPGKDEEQFKEFSLVGTANSAGIPVEYIEDFYAKWKQSIPKSGKKR